MVYQHFVHLHFRECGLTKAMRVCKFRMRLEDSEPWIVISQLARNRVSHIVQFVANICRFEAILVRDIDFSNYRFLKITWKSHVVNLYAILFSWRLSVISLHTFDTSSRDLWKVKVSSFWFHLIIDVKIWLFLWCILDFFNHGVKNSRFILLLHLNSEFWKLCNVYLLMFHSV